ncbi:hypothetical protein SUGI_0417540 [Cryptomeria japonica]|nr:hypothetical protein SUGI_0417540 [Cryptomeria japonica]
MGGMTMVGMGGTAARKLPKTLQTHGYCWEANTRSFHFQTHQQLFAYITKTSKPKFLLFAEPHCGCLYVAEEWLCRERRSTVSAVVHRKATEIRTETEGCAKVAPVSFTRQRWVRSPSLHILAIYVMPVTVSQNRRPQFASSATHGAISGKVRVIAREEVRLLRF